MRSTSFVNEPERGRAVARLKQGQSTFSAGRPLVRKVCAV
jgi:hypothetical protein